MCEVEGLGGEEVRSGGGLAMVITNAARRIFERIPSSNDRKISA